MQATESMPIHTVSTAIEPPLSEAAAEAWIPRTCFKNGPPSQIGVELELVVVDTRHPDGLAAYYPRHRYPALLRELADGGLDGRLTVEPGGQVELSSRPGPNLAHTVDAVHRDLSALRRRAARCGAGLLGVGVDPLRPPRRIAGHPRYVAMEAYLDAWGPAGRTMMCSTASVQVNVEAGVSINGESTKTRAASSSGSDHAQIGESGRAQAGDNAAAPTESGQATGSPLAAAAVGPADRAVPVHDVSERWDLLHAIGPALVAAFANSPRIGGRDTGWKSTRQAVWMDLDPARTGRPPTATGEGPGSAWTRWVLDAPLLLVRREHGAWTAPRGVSFRSWLRHGRAVIPDREPPDIDDLNYHMTTLFPQVRPRGHLEVRYIDAQPGPWWSVPAAVISGLLGDARAASAARDVCAPIEGRWLDAARFGTADPALGAAAASLLAGAADALRKTPDTARFAGHVDGYLDRWTARGRCPADDPPHLAAGDRKAGGFDFNDTEPGSTGTAGDEPS